MPDADQTQPMDLPDDLLSGKVVMGRPGDWAMVVDPVAEAAPGVVSASARQAAEYLASKVRVLERMGQAERISSETLAMLPHLLEHAPRHTAVLAVREILALLRVPRPAWMPRPEADDIGHPLRWYQPDRGDQGMPVAEDQPPARAGNRLRQIVTPRRQDDAFPGEPGWSAMMRRELGPGPG